LIGLKQTYIKISFANTSALIKVRAEINKAVKKNKEREKSNTLYMQMLSSTLAQKPSKDTSMLN
jgi:DNA polymerase epsilon subunit 1